MDLKLAGRKAIVCGASKGLGLACARALAGEGVHVVIAARNPETLEHAKAALESSAKVAVDCIAADVTTAPGQDALCAACPEPDILVTNSAGPPPGNYLDWDSETWHKAVENNMISPILLINKVIEGMIARKFGRIINITSSAVKAPIDVLGLSNGARAGLTGYIAGLARSVGRHNVTINNLLPGPFETGRLTKVLTAQAKMQDRAVDEVRAEWLAAIPTGKFGDPEEFGRTCAFLCASDHLNGQNIILDGGAFPGVF